MANPQCPENPRKRIYNTRTWAEILKYTKAGKAGALIGVTAALCMALAGCGTAYVRPISASPGEESGVFITDSFSTDASGAGAYHSAAPTINVGARAGGGEVVAFSKYRPTALVTPVSWLTWFGDQTVDVQYRDQIRVPITYWVVRGPFNQQRTLALNSATTTASIYWNERTGLGLTDIEVVDATGDSDGATYAAFTCGTNNANMTGLQRDIGARQGRINVYFVDTVDGVNSRGQACQIGGNFIALGRSVGTELLAHELGHNFALEHINNGATTQMGFDQTNIMHDASNSRAFVTEAQTFRAHLRPASAVNAVLGARPGQPTRDCQHGDATHTCPGLIRRIWADGSFPAN